MKTNIPIYRGKTTKQNFTKEEIEEDISLIKIDGIFYIVGLVVTLCNQIQSLTNDIVYSCEDGTLSIHHYDMLDGEDTKIFASLSEDGKGGDIVFVDEHYEGDFLDKAKSFTVCIEQGEYNFEFSDIHNYGVKVTGIQK